MSVHTLLLDFSVEPTHVSNDKQKLAYFAKIDNVLRDFLPNYKLVHGLNVGENATKIYTCDLGGLITLRIFDNGLITINIEYFKADGEKALLNFELEREISQSLIDDIGPVKKYELIPPITRDIVRPHRFYPTSDERLLEYDIDEVVFEERSPFQKISIMHSKSLGNMLVLDDLQNISEADLIYTETIMQRGIVQYENKEICILGGGDGALLYELLKENPKMVYMLEIDELVMEACNKHMKSICGNVLERRSAPNYEIIVGDCMEIMDKFIGEGRKFDYVFGDLTDVPISSDTTNADDWKFYSAVLEKALKIMKPTGYYLTHANGLNCEDALEAFEKFLNKMVPSVTYTKCKAFIPSFLEHWIFYQVQFKTET